MAEEKNEGGGEAPAKPKLKLDINIILPALSAVATLAAAGTLLYTKILYKKPVITESSELETIKAKNVKPKAAEPQEHPLVDMGELRVNVASSDSVKSHFAVFTLSVEVLDEESQEAVNTKKPQITDMIIAMMNKKQIAELNTIHGRQLLKEELISEMNKIAGDGHVIELYFSNFLVQ